MRPSTGHPVAGAVAEPELAALLDDAHADLGRVCAWMEGEALPRGPALLLKRARARVAAVRAYLVALDEDLPPPAPGEVPGRSLARAALPSDPRSDPRSDPPSESSAPSVSRRSPAEAA